MLAGCAPAGSLDGFDTTEVVVGAETLTVSVAETSSQRSQGLRHVEALPDGIEGMLFVFEEPTTPTFGMRDTLIPLDIWWFDDEGRLLGSTEMEPCDSEPCPSYRSPGEVVWALETPQGELELVPGDTLIPAPGG